VNKRPAGRRGRPDRHHVIMSNHALQVHRSLLYRHLNVSLRNGSTTSHHCITRKPYAMDANSGKSSYIFGHSSMARPMISTNLPCSVSNELDCLYRNQIAPCRATVARIRARHVHFHRSIARQRPQQSATTAAVHGQSDRKPWGADEEMSAR